ncbi:MAG: ribonuclease P protein component [Candidatus Magasanikbacteria bacterium]|nr:ribonuclease P protein component [Candidatus Magasanikbacteria bacterium]
MLQKENRLKKMKDFEILFKEGRYFNLEFLTLKVWKIDPEKYPRKKYSKDDLKIAFTVGLKVNKSAVKRNRVRRKMREVVRLLIKSEKIKKGFMAVLIAKPETLEKDYAEIEKVINKLLFKAHLIK